MTIPIRADAWRKSRHSDHDTCVEVHCNLGAVRDSKNPAGPTLAVDTATLVAAVKADEIRQ